MCDTEEEYIKKRYEELKKVHDEIKTARHRNMANARAPEHTNFVWWQLGTEDELEVAMDELTIRLGEIQSVNGKVEVA